MCGQRMNAGLGSTHGIEPAHHYVQFVAVHWVYHAGKGVSGIWANWSAGIETGHRLAFRWEH